MAGCRLVVAVASHKPYRMPDDTCYLPVRVGSALNSVIPGMESFQRDDVGDSISEKNPYYSELTALWWIWKNVDADFKGLVHYRRHFASLSCCRGHDRFARIASGAEIETALASSRDGIVLPRRRDYMIESVGDHYRHTMPAEQIDVAHEVIAALQPKYLEAFDRVLAGRKVHLFNMFVMRADALDAYCSWLFPLLFEIERRLDPGKYDPFNARYPGRVSERMLDAWITTEGFAYSELPTMSPEPVDWVKKGSSFLAAKFLGKKYGKSF